MKQGEEEKTAIRITQDMNIYFLQQTERIGDLEDRLESLKNLSKDIVKKYHERKLCDQDIFDFHTDLVKGEKEIWKSIHMKNGDRNEI